MPNAAVNEKNGRRPPKQAISPSVVRQLNRPSGSGDHQGARLRPPSPPTPVIMYVHEYSNVSPFRNPIGFTPSVENRHVCMFAKPAQNGGTLLSSAITIAPGNALVGVRVEVGQSLNTRRCSTALFGSGVANAVAARHAPANASARVVIRLMGMSPTMKGEGRLTTRCGPKCSQRPVGLRRKGRGSERRIGPVTCPGLRIGGGHPRFSDPPGNTAQGVALDPQFRCRVNGYICVVAVSRLRLRCACVFSYRPVNKVQYRVTSNGA